MLDQDQVHASPSLRVALDAKSNVNRLRPRLVLEGIIILVFFTCGENRRFSLTREDSK